MGVVEVVGLVDRQRLSRFQARAHRTGPGAPLGPLRTQIEPRLAQAVAEEGIAEELDRHAFAVGKQQHVVLPRHLAEQVFEPRTGDGDQILRLLAVFPKSRFRNDIGFTTLRRIEPVMLQERSHDFTTVSSRRTGRPRLTRSISRMCSECETITAFPTDRTCSSGRVCAWQGRK